MLSKEMISSKDSFSNPFEDINANVLDSKRIVEYWCSPFEVGLLSDYDENKFRTCHIPIILQGPRGSGKTTILKYFSFPAQLERTQKMKKKSIVSTIKSEGEVGFYFRCEDSFISTFEAVFKNANPEHWTKIFDSYIELVFSEKILDMLFEINRRDSSFSIRDYDISKITEVLDVNDVICNLDELKEYVHKQVLYYEQYKNRVLFTDDSFSPNILLNLFSLSETIVLEIKKTNKEFENVLFVLMIDEFENLSLELQKRFNTIIKFISNNISIRVGRRSEGLITTETVNSTEYLRENHDYLLAALESKLDSDNKAYNTYFKKIANKRFYSFNKMNVDDKFDICDVLGDKEDLDNECLENCGRRKKHLEVVLKQSKELENNNKQIGEIISIIKNDQNPIAETLNALWVLRSKKDYLNEAKEVALIMQAFFNKEDYPRVEKYKLDYSNKYRYAITTYICSVYKREKLYYSFNTICYLSNGNARTFINYCRSIISEALFYERDVFLKIGKISKRTQSRAVHNYSRSEFDSICSIVDYGDCIRNFIMNIGNCFSAYHKDRKIRYPETNQFSYDESQIDPQDREILKTAESWAIIMKRAKTQRVSAGKSDRADLYHMNRMFHPIFNISYRIRGGVNLVLDEEDVRKLLHQESYYPKSVKKLMDSQEVKNDTNNEPYEQLSFFEFGDIDD